MDFILFGILLIVVGSSLIFFRDFWWEMTEFGNQWEGQASERTSVWDVKNIFVGVIIIGFGLVLIWGGVTIVNRPVIPEVCRYCASGDDSYVRYIKNGCAAAQKKDYKTALSSFNQALTAIQQQRVKIKQERAKIKKPESGMSDAYWIRCQDHLVKAVQQMNQRS